jgi:hypothetical protein
MKIDTAVNTTACMIKMFCGSPSAKEIPKQTAMEMIAMRLTRGLRDRFFFHLRMGAPSHLWVSSH